MKKDIEWLRKDFDRIIDQSVRISPDKEWDRGWNLGWNEARNAVHALTNQLDEPEVLSSDWIDDHKVARINNLRKMTTDDVVSVKDLQNLLVPKQDEITHKQVEKYLLDKNIRVIDIDIYEEMQSELEELKNGATLSKTETVADVLTTFWKSYERLKEVMSMEVEEMEE